MIYANKPATIDELRTNIEREIAAVSADLCLKIVEIGFCVWTSASVPVVAMQKKSSFIHNGIERTFTFLFYLNLFFVALLLKTLYKNSSQSK